MSAIKRYLEDLIYNYKYDFVCRVLLSQGWRKEDIDELYDTYEITH